MGSPVKESGLLPFRLLSWDRPDAFGLKQGKGAGSATPLCLSMAQLVRLALSIDHGSPIETPKIVADRYTAAIHDKTD
jgi:glucoamylase